VIERDIRRWAHDDHHALSVDAHLLERVGVDLEVGEIVLLLETRISEQLLRPDAESLQPLGRHGVREDHPFRQPAPDLMLADRDLVLMQANLII
jgi:hypothetical protein